MDETKVRAWVEGAKRAGRGNEWLRVGPMRVYVRWARRYHPVRGESVDALDLATVEVAEETERKRGRFSEFLELWERLAAENGRWVYVESVMPGFLRESLLRRGYEATGEEGENFWKRPS